MMNNFFKNTALLVIVLLISMPAHVFAQPGFNPGVPNGVPLDGGISLLVIAGISYGAKKIYGKRKNNEDIAEK